MLETEMSTRDQGNSHISNSTKEEVKEKAGPVEPLESSLDRLFGESWCRE